MAIPLRPEEVPKDLICPICLDLPSDPYALKTCSHVFCEDCFYESHANKPQCPVCRCECTLNDLSPLECKKKSSNKIADLPYRIWSSIMVRCELHQDGCDWTGSIADYRYHKKHCSQKEKFKTIESLKAENDQLKCAVQGWNHAYNSLEDVNEELEGINENVRAENKAMKSENTKVKAENKKLSAANKKLVVDKKRLTVQVEDTKDDIQYMRAHNNALKAKNQLYEKMQAESKVLHAKNEEIKVGNSKLYKKMDTNYQSLKARNKKILTENKKLKIEKKKLADEKKDVCKQLSSVTIATKVQNRKLNREKLKMEQQIHTLRDEIALFEKTITKLEMEEPSLETSNKQSPNRKTKKRKIAN